MQGRLMVRFIRVLCFAVSPLICAHSLLAEETPQEAAKVEFFEKDIDAGCKFSWRSDKLAKQIVPAEVLFH